MAASAAPPRVPRRPIVPDHAEWVIAPLPLFTALVAHLLGPEDARELADRLMLVVNFQVLLPLMALMASIRACWRPAGDASVPWSSGGALLAGTAGALAGQALLETTWDTGTTMIPAASWALGLALPLWTASLLVSRTWRAGPALVRAAGAVSIGLAGCWLAAAALHLDTWGFGLGAATGGAVLATTALLWRGLARRGPRSSVRLLLALGLASTVPAVAVQGWLASPPVDSHIPVWVYNGIGGGRALVQGYSPRNDNYRFFELALDSGELTPLHRRARTVCRLPDDTVAMHLEGLGQRLPGPTSPTRLAVHERGTTRFMAGSLPGTSGLLVCSTSGHVLWSAGSDLVVWEPTSGTHWAVDATPAEVAFACVDSADGGMLYRLRGGDPPPYPRRYLPLVEGATPLSGPEVDHHRCDENWHPGNDLHFIRPMPHSGDPWQLQDRINGTTTDIEEDPYRVGYGEGGYAATLLRSSEDEYRVIVWRAGEGPVASFPTEGANSLTLLHDGRWVLLDLGARTDAGSDWIVYRWADGTVVRSGTSRRFFPVGGDRLLDLHDGKLELLDLVSGEAETLMPQERRRP